MSSVQTCVLIPIHAPKFKSVIECLGSLAGHQQYSFHLFFILGTRLDMSRYEEKVKIYEPKGLSVGYIIFEEDNNDGKSLRSVYGDERTVKGSFKDCNRSLLKLGTPSVESSKKLYAIEYILTQYPGVYKYIWTPDCDILFLDVTGFTRESELFCSQKVIIAGGEDHPKLRSSIKRGLALLRDSDKERAEKVGGYFWFSDAPIFDAELAKGFLRYIDFNDRKGFCSRVRGFAIMAYIYYCILYHNYKTFRISILGSLEVARVETIASVSKGVRKPIWITLAIWKEYQKRLNRGLPPILDKFGKPLTFKIAFHTDRYRYPEPV